MYLFVVDYFVCLLCSFGLSYAILDSLEYFWIIYICLLPITSFLREHEAKIKGRLQVIERKEFLKTFDDYDNYVYIVNDKVDNIDNLD